jgi:hypothetical protein
MDPLAVRAGRAPAGQAQHPRLARAVNVRVEDSHLGALGVERERQVDGRRGFADPALAGGHRDDVADARERLQAGLHGARLDIPLDIDRHLLDPGQRAEQRREFLLQFLFIAVGREAEPQDDRQSPVLEGDVRDRAGRDEVRFDDRVDPLRQQGARAVDGCLGHATPRGLKVRSGGRAL